MDRFEVIIVGAGLAGLAAAYTLAGEGVEVVVLERGEYPGAKNVSGGRLYLNPVRDLFPGLREDAPLERTIVHEGITLMAKGGSVALNYSGEELRRTPGQSRSVLRSRFDRWLGERAEERGAAILPNILVENPVIDNGRVVGVTAGGDDLAADVVIACDGALSLTAEKAGLRQPGQPRDFAVGIKEVVALEAGKINDRFHVSGEEGAARLYLGEVTQGLFGGGFLYTNLDSVSIGLVIRIQDILGDSGVALPDLAEDFRKRPEIASLIGDGTVVEYSAHVIPEGGLRGMGRLYGDGILVAGDAAGLALNLGLTVRGMEYALASGYYAAQAVLQAKKKNDFSASGLSSYRTLLEDSFVLQDFRRFAKTPDVLENPRFFRHYPELAGAVFRDLYTVPAGPKDTMYSTVRRHVGLREIWHILKDLRKASDI
jgi:electron transfer flavoprotein-quinone oxidoreductase